MLASCNVDRKGSAALLEETSGELTPAWVWMSCKRLADSCVSHCIYTDVLVATGPARWSALEVGQSQVNFLDSLKVALLHSFTHTLSQQGMPKGPCPFSSCLIS